MAIVDRKPRETDSVGRVQQMLAEETGQAVAEFSMVVFLLVLILFSILETGLLLNEKLVLTSAAREVARVCAVEGGKTQGALSRLEELLTLSGIEPSRVSADITPNQAIYGTTIRVSLEYDYEVLSPVVSSVIGGTITLTAKAVTRSEFVPR
jgi:Flp pilus assembly protein TadG